MNYFTEGVSGGPVADSITVVGERRVERAAKTGYH